MRFIFSKPIGFIEIDHCQVIIEPYFDDGPMNKRAKRSKNI